MSDIGARSEGDLIANIAMERGLHTTCAIT